MVDYVDKILKSPNAPMQIRALQEAILLENNKRQEFREWVTPSMKAEFINGSIVMHSPVKRKHWKVTNLLSRLMSTYVSFYQLGEVGVEKIMISLTRNDYEPDLVFFSKEKSDEFREDQLLFPAPDLVVEILSRKTATIDKGLKMIDYAAHGISEYWIIDSDRQTVAQHYLVDPKDTEYFPAKVLTKYDMIASRVIKGFEIPVFAIFEDEANLEAMNKLMKSI
ncbi:MAG TPA: Uma2 family endonuclease [Saprospiraceae bacterium]|nr:Uma2 family endonuclease [Saprospiraceae bacterium]